MNNVTFCVSKRTREMAIKDKERSCSRLLDIYIVYRGPYCYKTFSEKSSFERWMSERKLSLVEDLPDDEDEFGHVGIKGNFTQRSYLTYEDFYALKESALHDTRIIDNGDFVRCFITEENGEIFENILNCNLKQREVFDFLSSVALAG